MAQWLDATIIERIDWNDHLFSLRFQCPEFPTFTAGQFAKIGIQTNDGKVLSRPYSLVNSPQDDFLEIIAVPVEQGSLSPQLQDLGAGDSVKVMAPATGFLVLDEVPQSDALFMLATGTGVGPFLSILQTEQPWLNYEKIILVYAVRTIDDLAYREMIESFAEKHPLQFCFVPIVSREAVGGALQGRIPELISSEAIQSTSGVDIAPDTSQVMMCGNPGMIEGCFEALQALGLKKHLRRSPGHISVERYW